MPGVSFMNLILNSNYQIRVKKICFWETGGVSFVITKSVFNKQLQQQQKNNNNKTFSKYCFFYFLLQLIKTKWQHNNEDDSAFSIIRDDTT